MRISSLSLFDFNCVSMLDDSILVGWPLFDLCQTLEHHVGVIGAPPAARAYLMMTRFCETDVLKLYANSKNVFQ